MYNIFAKIIIITKLDIYQIIVLNSKYMLDNF